MTKKIILIFQFYFVSIGFVYSSNKIDSLLNVLKLEKTDSSKIVLLNEISQEYLKSDFKKALKSAEDALLLAKKINNKKGIALSYTYIAYAQYRLSNYSEAKICINKSLVIYEILEDKLRVSKCYSFISQIHYAQQQYVKAIEFVNKSIEIKLNNNITTQLEINYLTCGAIYQKQGKYKLALKNFFEAVKYYDINKNSKNKASVYNNIAITYRNINNLGLAEEYYKKSLELYRLNKNKFGELKIYNNLAVLFEKKGMNDSAIKNYLKVIELSKNVNFKGGIAMAQINIAGIYIEFENKLKQAKELLDKSEKICIETSDKYKLITVYGLNGQLFEKQGNMPKAIYFTKKAYDIAINIKDSKNTFEIAIQLSEFYKKTKDYKNSLKYFEIYSITKDSVFNIEKESAIQEMKARFETEQKDKELKIKSSKIEILEKEKRIKSLENYSLIIGIITIFIIAIFVVIFYRNKIAKNKLLAQKNAELHKSQKKTLKLEVKTQEFEKIQLENELKFKDKELQNFAFHIVDKNDFIERLKKELLKIQKNTSENDFKKEIRNILLFINDKMLQERDREEFIANIEQIYSNFFVRLEQKYPALSKNDRRLASLLRMGLQSKEISAILHITPKSVDTNRYRLRKKLELDSDVNLNEFVKNI